jgi:hypothetical protein
MLKPYFDLLRARIECLGTDVKTWTHEERESRCRSTETAPVSLMQRLATPSIVSDPYSEYNIKPPPTTLRCPKRDEDQMMGVNNYSEYWVHTTLAKYPLFRAEPRGSW